MAGILRSCGRWDGDSLISFLIVATTEICNKIFEAIESESKSKNYRIKVHKCEFISDFTSVRPNLHVDFIIFGFDGRISGQINQVEKSIYLVDEIFVITGRICLVNCYGLSNTMGLMCQDANRLRDKFRLPLISARVNTSENLQNLAERIFNLAEALMGIRTGVPDLNLLTSL